MARTKQTKYNGGDSHNVKTSPSPGSWQNLPHHVFGDIITIIGKESLQDLQKCRQVSKSWNMMMSQVTKYNKDTIRKKAESLDAQIRNDGIWFYPTLPEITTAASLAHHGLFGSVQIMVLEYLDLASVPAEHLASLAACVKGSVYIKNVRNCDLISVLDSSKSEVIEIDKQSLSTAETEALVRAMANVEGAELGYWGKVTVDISTLVTYDSRGKCKKVRLYNDTAVKYREEIRRWAQRISWRVTRDDNSAIFIERN